MTPPMSSLNDHIEYYVVIQHETALKVIGPCIAVVLAANVKAKPSDARFNFKTEVKDK